jgi:hypothetical protein
MRSQMRWSNSDYMKHYSLKKVPKELNSNGNPVHRSNKGKLLYPHPEPRFLGDPGHHCKSIKGCMHKRKAMKKADRLTICDVDILRLSTNFRYMCDALPTLGKSKWTSASKAVVEHHFGNHDFCRSFCKWKTMTEEEKKLSDRFYRSKSTDAELHKWLSDLIDYFTTMEKLEEIGHGMDTNVRASLVLGCQNPHQK